MRSFLSPALLARCVAIFFMFCFRCCHQHLLLHLVSSPKPAIAKSMEHFGIRETSLNGLGAQGINGFSALTLEVLNYFLFVFFPDMPLYGALFIFVLATLVQ